MGQPMRLCCDAVCGGGVRVGTMPLALLSAGFQSLPLIPTSKPGPSGADCWVGGFVYVLGPCGSLQWTLLWGWEFLPLPPQSPQVFSIRGLRLYFPALEPWVVRSILLPSCSSQFICTWMWNRPVCKTPPRLSASCCLAVSPPPSCPSLSLLPVWMNVSSLTPWLSDFHTVLFSVSSGCFLFLNLLLSFFWLCEEAQCVYLCFHLVWKSRITVFQIYMGTIINFVENHLKSGLKAQ